MSKFHRFFDPTYYLFSGETFPTTPGLTGTIGGAIYDRINVTSGGTGVGPGSEKPAPMDDTKSSGVNRYTHFVAFGEDGTSFDTNRGLKALAENSDLVDDLLRTSIPKKAQVAGTAVAPVSSLAVAGDVFVGDAAVAPGDLVYLTDASGHVLYNGVAPVLVTAIDDGTPGNNVIGTGWHTAPTIRVSPPIPAGSYQVVYGARTSTARRVEREREVGWWMHESHSAMHADSAFQAGLDERYRRIDGITDPAAVARAGQPGSGARIIRDGQALEVMEPDTDYATTLWPDPFLAAFKVTRQTLNNPAVLPGYSGLTGFALISKSAMGGDTGGVGALGDTYADFANFYYRSTTSGDTNLPPNAPVLLSGDQATLTTAGQRFRNGSTGRLVVGYNSPANDLLEITIGGVTKLYVIVGVGTVNAYLKNIDGTLPSWPPGTAATVNLVHVPFRVGHDGVVIHQPPYNNPASAYGQAALSVYADQVAGIALTWGSHEPTTGTTTHGQLRGNGDIDAVRGFFGGDVTIGYTPGPHYNLTVHGALTVDDNSNLSNALLSGYLKIGNYTASVPPLAAGNAGIEGGLGVMGESTLYDKLELMKAYDPLHPGLLVHGFAHFNAPSTFDAPVSIDSILNLKSGLFLGTTGAHASTSDLYVDALNIIGATILDANIPTTFRQDVTHNGLTLTDGSRLILEGSTVRRTPHASTGTGNIVINNSDLPYKRWTLSASMALQSFGLNLGVTPGAGDEFLFDLIGTGANFQVSPAGGWAAGVSWDHEITRDSVLQPGGRQYRMEMLASGGVYFSSRQLAPYSSSDVRDVQKLLVDRIRSPHIVGVDGYFPGTYSVRAAVTAVYRDSSMSFHMEMTSSYKVKLVTQGDDATAAGSVPGTHSQANFENYNSGIGVVADSGGLYTTRPLLIPGLALVVGVDVGASHDASCLWYYNDSIANWTTWGAQPVTMQGVVALAGHPTFGTPGGPVPHTLYVLARDGIYSTTSTAGISRIVDYSSGTPFGGGVVATDICVVGNVSGYLPVVCCSDGTMWFLSGATWYQIPGVSGGQLNAICATSDTMASTSGIYGDVIAVGDSDVHMAHFEGGTPTAEYSGDLSGYSMSAVAVKYGVLLSVAHGSIPGVTGTMYKSWLAYSTNMGRSWTHLYQYGGNNTQVGQGLITTVDNGFLVALGRPSPFVAYSAGHGYLDITI